MAVWFIISMWQSFIDRLIIRVVGHNVSFNHEVIILCCSNIIMHQQSNDINIKFPLNILTTHFLCVTAMEKQKQQQQQWHSIEWHRPRRFFAFAPFFLLLLLLPLLLLLQFLHVFFFNWNFFQYPNDATGYLVNLIMIIIFIAQRSILIYRICASTTE